MDRSWMSKDRMSREYEEGVEYFINFALEHCPNQRGIRCPYMRCGNLIHHTPNKIRENICFSMVLTKVIVHGIGMEKQVLLVDNQLKWQNIMTRWIVVTLLV